MLSYAQTKTNPNPNLSVKIFFFWEKKTLKNEIRVLGIGNMGAVGT